MLKVVGREGEETSDREVIEEEERDETEFVAAIEDRDSSDTM